MTVLTSVNNLIQTGISKAVFKAALANIRQVIAEKLGTTGAQSESLTLLGVPFHSSMPKSGAYTVVEADRGKVIRCSGGAWSLALSAAATLGDGFVFGMVNENATGNITLDPYVSETIEGATTKAMLPGTSAIVYCDGTKFSLLGGGVTSADIVAALGYTPATSTHNHTGTYAPMTAVTAAVRTSVGGEGEFGITFTRANGTTFYVQIQAPGSGGGE